MNNLFVFDGIDGCGKTTVSRLVAERLEEKKYPVVHCQMPGGTSLGAGLRLLLKSRDFKPHVISERLMFAADFNQHLREIIEPAKAAGKIVICDRWSAFTDYQYGLAADVPSQVFTALYQLCAPVLKPDILFYVEVSIRTAMLRRESRNVGAKSPEVDCRIEAKGDSFMDRVAKNYAQAAHNGGFGSENVERIFCQDGERKPHELAAQAVELIEMTVNKPR